MNQTSLAIHPALRDVERSLDGYTGRYADLRFIVSVAREADGKLWLHASVSKRSRSLPSYEDLAMLKHFCIGDDKTAYQVFPSEDKYVHSPPIFGGKTQVLHLWHCLDGDPLPEFSRVVPGVGRTI